MLCYFPDPHYHKLSQITIMLKKKVICISSWLVSVVHLEAYINPSTTILIWLDGLGHVLAGKFIIIPIDSYYFPGVGIPPTSYRWTFSHPRNPRVPLGWLRPKHWWTEAWPGVRCFVGDIMLHCSSLCTSAYIYIYILVHIYIYIYAYIYIYLHIYI